MRILSIFKIFQYAFFIVLLGVGVTTGYAMFEYIQMSRVSPPYLGNQPEKLLKMEKDTSAEPYSFLVIGDTRGRIDIMEKFLSSMEKSEPAFLVHLGDFVQYCTSPDEYRFFATEIGETGFNRPIFVIPGNHEIKRFHPSSQAVFEKFYYSTNFSFRFRNSLFVFLSSQGKESFLPALKFLEGILKSESAQTAHYRFIFLHCLPDFSRNNSLKDGSTADKLLDLVERYKVTYVFAGHIHTYHREQVKGCVFISPGSGGATIRRKEVDPYYHCLEITVTPERVKERLLSLKFVFPLEDQVEYFLFRKLLRRINEKFFTTSGRERNESVSTEEG